MEFKNNEISFIPRRYLIILGHLIYNYYLSKSELNIPIDNVIQIGSDIILPKDDESDNCTSDPAAWYEWLSAKEVKEEKVIEIDGVCDVIEGERERELPKQKLTFKESYDAVMRFIKIYDDRFNSDDIKEFARYLTFKKWQKTCTEFSSNNPYTKNPNENSKNNQEEMDAEE